MAVANLKRKRRKGKELDQTGPKVTPKVTYPDRLSSRFPRALYNNLHYVSAAPQLLLRLPLVILT